MKRQKGRKHLNNRGISLVEILVAFTILAIVVGPLLKVFLTATKFNVRAKERQRVTAAAQSVMEGLKAFDIETVCMQFNGDSAFLIYPDSAVTSFSEPTPSMQMIDGVSTFVEKPGGIYQFVMQGITYEGTAYDAKIDIAGKTQADVYVAEQINGYKDAVYRQAADLDTTVYSLILQNVLDKLNELDEFYEYELIHLDKTKIQIDKTTTVNITESSGIQMVTVDCAYTYAPVHYPYYDAAGAEHFMGEEPGDPSPLFAPLTYSYTIYDNTNTRDEGAKLENLYLYYYPAYSSSISGAPIQSDIIRINNTTGSSLSVYLLKQKRGLGNLLTLENSYTPDVYGIGDLVLHHNLTTNLADETSTCGHVDFSGFTSKDTDLLEKKSEYLLYSVKVSIYKEGAAAGGFLTAPLLELEGTINGK